MDVVENTSIVSNKSDDQEQENTADCKASTSAPTCDIVDEIAVPAEGEKPKKKRTRRGKKKCKQKTEEIENTNVESDNEISQITAAVVTLSLNHNVPDKEVVTLLNSNGLVKAQTFDNSINETGKSETVNNEPLESAGNSLSSGSKKVKKKKKSKKKTANSVHSSSTQSSNVHKDCPSDSLHQLLETLASSSKQEIKASCKKRTKTSSSSSKEKTTFDKYITSDEVMSGLATNVLIGGAIRINQKYYKEAYINSPDKGQDILIEGMQNRNRALEGDDVVIRLNPESEWKVHNSKIQKTGVVVYIREKIHPRIAAGFLKPMTDGNKEYALFSPRDSRVPRIKIPMAKCPEKFLEEAEKYKNIIFIAHIRDWQHVNYALGDIVEEIGICGDIKSETKALLLENDIDFLPHDIELYQYFPRSPYQISEEEINSRADLRNECIFTIDPLTARDLDDAVSCKELENGNLKIGVHISDVSFFLTEGTPLDQEVSRKATTTYLVESVYHMLPRELCLMCSLLPGEDKLTFSVFWEITPEAEIVSHHFTRSVINSCTQLAYEHAQLMLENPDKEWSRDELPRIYGNHSPEEISRVVNHLNRLAIIMRGRRFEGGALRIDQPKLIFSLESGTGLPLEYTLYVNKECHRLIEEFMLLANMTVAARLKEDYPELAFLRCHPAPHRYIMEELQKTLEQRGIFLDIDSAGSLQSSMWRYAGDDFVSQARMMVLNNLCAKPMTRAKYFCAKFREEEEEEFWHYALNVPLYTHFTSPIRRYADVMVHRLLSASLGYTPKPEWHPDYVQAIASNCNKQKYQAKRAGEQSIELYLTVFIGLHSPMIEEAVVMDVKDQSFDIIVCSTGLTQRVYTNKMAVPAKVMCRTEDKKIIAQEIEWLPTNEVPYSTLQIVEIFSIVTVELFRSPATLKVDTRLLRPPGTGAYFN